jgi:ribosomal protein S18 acetylase RimI-like enzyme
MITPTYQIETGCTVNEYRSLLLSSGLASRRPVDDLPRLDSMLRNANLVVTARIDGVLVGIARSVTDFAFCCYLSDLAVQKDCQGLGIGAKLIDETRTCIGPAVSLILSSVPEAVSFYEGIGMPQLPNGFWFRRER